MAQAPMSRSLSPAETFCVQARKDGLTRQEALARYEAEGALIGPQKFWEAWDYTSPVAARARRTFTRDRQRSLNMRFTSGEVA